MLYNYLPCPVMQQDGEGKYGDGDENQKPRQQHQPELGDKQVIIVVGAAGAIGSLRER